MLNISQKSNVNLKEVKTILNSLLMPDIQGNWRFSHKSFYELSQSNQRKKKKEIIVNF